MSTSSGSYNQATTTALTKEHITNATNAINTYISAIQGYNKRLATVMEDMSDGKGSFVGDASTGYQTFYTTYVLPAITTNLIDGENCLTTGALSMLKMIGNTMLDITDPDLGTFNKNPGAAATEAG